MWYFGHKRRPLSWPVSPGFFVKVLHWKSEGLMKLSRVNHLNLPSLEVKDPKYQTEKDTGPGPKIFQESRFCQPPPAMVAGAPLTAWGLCTFTAHQLGNLRDCPCEKRAAKNSGKKVTFSHGFLITQNGVQVMLFPCATVSWIFRLRLGVCPNRSWWMHVLLHWWHHRALVHFCPLSELVVFLRKYQRCSSWKDCVLGLVTTELLEAYRWNPHGHRVIADSLWADTPPLQTWRTHHLTTGPIREANITRHSDARCSEAECRQNIQGTGCCFWHPLLAAPDYRHNWASKMTFLCVIKCVRDPELVNLKWKRLFQGVLTPYCSAGSLRDLIKVFFGMYCHTVSGLSHPAFRHFLYPTRHHFVFLKLTAVYQCILCHIWHSTP